MVDFFIQGGGFMWPILIALLFGLAIIGERAYSLVNSISNTDQFFEDVKSTFDNTGKEQAIELCENTSGPVASIFYAGLSKMEKTKEEIEKAVQNAGGLEMAFLEKNMIVRSKKCINQTEGIWEKHWFSFKKYSSYRGNNNKPNKPR